MNYAIKTYNLTKTYGNFRALHKVNLNVKYGEIYGFLGLNGAGKTTTIRTLLGMIRPSTGNVNVLGQSISQGGSGPWARIGHMVESPSAYPELTVRENLEIARRMHGITNQSSIDDVMERLALTSYADRKAGMLSSGNFQRLGLARALLHKPELLILDEPANALDPAGIVEIRKLLLMLVREHGTTIFMSSHILAEVEVLADRIGIIHKGELVEELDAIQLEQLRVKQLIVGAHDLVKVREVLSGFANVSVNGHVIIKDPRAVEAPERIATLLVNAGVPPTHLAVEQEGLEEHFLRLTN